MDTLCENSNTGKSIVEELTPKNVRFRDKEEEVGNGVMIDSPSGQPATWREKLVRQSSKDVFNSLDEKEKKIYNMWRPTASMHMMDIENGYFLMKFQNKMDYEKTLSEGPWIIFGPESGSGLVIKENNGLTFDPSRDLNRDKRNAPNFEKSTSGLGLGLARMLMDHGEQGAVEFFERLYGETPLTLGAILSFGFPKITSSEITFLEADITNEEIKRALFDMTPLKVTRRDGYHVVIISIVSSSSMQILWNGVATQKFKSVGGCKKINPRFNLNFFSGDTWVFLSTDGVVARDSGYAATGGVVRDQDGNWILGYNRFLGLCSPFEAEVWNILDGILILLNKGYRRAIILTDILEVTQILTDLSLEDFGTTVLRRTQRIMKTKGTWRIKFILRSQNLVGDCVAKLSLNWKSSLQVLNEAPKEILDFL
ncbi:hypothetical protein PVK06_019218 [Gossypium arboreum]|uniref:DUF4283 domain-containing protein n=1 Tax=Gossypium arboreum TaxID=29729 RepID=A0ABR0PJD5_GOSAR|nr:hypothetical protein PVK06_019218 [Gossypium arboreum]